MIKLAVPAIALCSLAACSGQSDVASFSCANGPEILARYSENSVSLEFSNGRTVSLPRPDESRPNLYFDGSTRWAVGVREARLDEDRRSLLCDQLS